MELQEKYDSAIFNYNQAIRIDGAYAKTMSRIANANRWVDPHINRMVPQLGLSISHRSGDDVIGFDTSN